MGFNKTNTQKAKCVHVIRTHRTVYASTSAPYAQMQSSKLRTKAGTMADVSPPVLSNLDQNNNKVSYI